MLFGDNSEDDESCSTSSNNSLFNEIEDFVIECAVFESQRWLEIVTGEGCAIPENLPKSLLEGKQLRKNNSLKSNHHPQSHIEYSFRSSRDALRRICVTVLKLSKLYKEQYPDCNKTHIFDPEEGRKLLDLHKQKICNHPIELQIRKRPRFTFSTTTPSMNFTNKKYGAQSLPRGATTDLSRNRRNSDFNMQSCSMNSPLQDIIAANEDVERWRERRRRSMNRTSEEPSIIIEESKPLLLYSSSINCSEPLHVQASPPPPPLLPPLPNLITHPYLKDTQEQIIIASPKQQQQQRTEGSSQDSGLENSTPEVSPPGAAQSSRNHWRNESESSLSSFTSDKFHSGGTSATTATTTTKPVLPSTESIMTRKNFVSTKRSLAPSPPNETTAVQQFSSLTLETNQIECNANAKFLCRKDYSEAAICKAVVAQGALEETSAKVKAIPMTIRTAQTGGKYSSVRIEVEATRENHAKVAAIKSVSAKEHQKTTGNFKPMCELIDEDLQRRRSPCSLQSSISPASSSKSSDFGADNRSLDRMSFGSGGHLYGNDYKVVALNAKPEPGKLTEFVPEVERNKPSEREEYVVSSYGSANGATRSPPLDAAVVRNWELSDEESPSSKSPVNNNNTEKLVTTTAKIDEHVDTIKYDYPHLGKVFALGKSKDLEYSPDIPTIIIPPYPKSGDKKKRSKSIESNKSAKSTASNKTDSTFASFKSAASKSFSQRSKTSSKGIPAHSDTDSLQSPEPVLVVNTSQVIDSEEDEEQPVIHITKKSKEIDEIIVVNDSSSSIEDVSKENTLRVTKSSQYHPRTTIEVEEETLHYAESQVNAPRYREGEDDEDLDEEQQYANINTDTLRSNRSLDISEMHNLHPNRPQKVKTIEREDTAEFERYTPSKEPLFYDTVAKYGFDPSGGYHVPKQLYRRDVPIRIEEPRHVPKSTATTTSNTLPTKQQPIWNSHPLSRYREEDETKISRVTYRFYDRDMHELSSNTFVDKAKRATRSVEDGIEHPIYQLETSYYPQSASADRKFIRSQGYPTPFNANSKNYVKADSKFQILPKTEERPRPKIVKKEHHSHHQQQPHQQQQHQQQQQPQLYGLSDTRRVHNDSRHPSGAPQPRADLFSEEPKPLKEKSQSMLTVSGKLRCAHCTCELGRGSAMIIEALGLFYHINCFRCHVCDKMLGTGSQTTDVRVRDGKLHCEKCYSNEDIGVRLSEI